MIPGKPTSRVTAKTYTMKPNIKKSKRNDDSFIGLFLSMPQAKEKTLHAGVVLVHARREEALLAKHGRPKKQIDRRYEDGEFRADQIPLCPMFFLVRLKKA